MATLANVEPGLVSRIQWVIDQAAKVGVVFTVTTGQRGLVEQNMYWSHWVAALAKVGCRTPRSPTPEQYAKAQANGGIVGAFPGTSNHGRILNGVLQQATAVDLACGEKDIALRDDLAKKAGLHQPVHGEKWHMEVALNAGPLPAAPTAPPLHAAPAASSVAGSNSMSEEDEDDMNREVAHIEWPNGGHTQVFSDGRVAAHGPLYAPLPHFGDIGNERPEDKLSFKWAADITPIDLNDPQKGYTIWDQDNNHFDYNQDTLNKFLGK